MIPTLLQRGDLAMASHLEQLEGSERSIGAFVQELAEAIGRAAPTELAERLQEAIDAAEAFNGGPGALRLVARRGLEALHAAARLPALGKRYTTGCESDLADCKSVLDNLGAQDLALESLAAYLRKDLTLESHATARFPVAREHGGAHFIGRWNISIVSGSGTGRVAFSLFGTSANDGNILCRPPKDIRLRQGVERAVNAAKRYCGKSKIDVLFGLEGRLANPDQAGSAQIEEIVGESGSLALAVGLVSALQGHRWAFEDLLFSGGMNPDGSVVEVYGQEDKLREFLDQAHCTRFICRFQYPPALPELTKKLLVDVSDLGRACELASTWTISPEKSHADIIRGYLETVCRRYKYVPIPTFGKDRTERTAPLSDVYVTLFGIPGSNKEMALRASERDRLGATYEPSIVDRRHDLRRFATSVETAQNLDEVLSKARYVLVQGDPGTGKTTLLYQLLVRLASKRLNRNQSRQPVPIFIRAAELAAFIEAPENAGANLSSFFGRNSFPKGGAAAVSGWESITPDKLNEALIQEGRDFGSILLIDGLDEVRTPELRVRVRDLIDDFISLSYSQKTADQVLVTSRIVGYEQAQLRSIDRRYTIEKLDDSTIRTLATNWLKSVSGLADEGAATARDFLEQLFATEMSGIRRLAENPFHLTLLVSVYWVHRRLPSRRADLFKIVLDDNLLKVLEKRISSADEFSRSLLERLAFDLHSRSVTGRISETNLRAILERFRSDYSVTGVSEDFLFDLVTIHSGVMVERGDKEFAFGHRSLQEYLAGRCLFSDKTLSPENLVEKGLDPLWSEAFALAIGHASTSLPKQEFERRLTDLICVRSDDLNKIPDGAMCVSKALEEVSSTPIAALNGILDIFLNRYCSSSFLAQMRPFEQFVENFVARSWGNCNNESAPEVAVENAIVERLTSKDPLVASRAATLITRRRIYSSKIAGALVAAQPNDSAETDWTLHRSLYILLSRPVVENALTPADTDADDDILASMEAEGYRFQVVDAPPERTKSINKLAALDLPQLKFRRWLMSNPEICETIANNRTWLGYFVALGIGGFGEWELGSYEYQLGSSLCMRDYNQARLPDPKKMLIAEDVFLRPICEKLTQIPLQFRPETVIADPPNSEAVMAAIVNGADPAELLKSLTPDAFRTGLSRTFVIGRDAIMKSHSGRANSMDATYVLAHAMRHATIDMVYSWALLLDTIGNNLEKDPLKLIREMASAILIVELEGLQKGKLELLWNPRSDADALHFCMEFFDSLPPKLGFLHGWFVGAVDSSVKSSVAVPAPVSPQSMLERLLGASKERSASLAQFEIELLVRCTKFRYNNYTFDDVLRLIPGSVEEANRSSILANLRKGACQIESPYARCRAFIALAQASPEKHGDLLRIVEESVRLITDNQDKSIVLFLLAKTVGNPTMAKKHRQSAIQWAERRQKGKTIDPLFVSTLKGQADGELAVNLLAKLSDPPDSPSSAALSWAHHRRLLILSERSDDDRLFWQEVLAEKTTWSHKVRERLGRGWIDLNQISVEYFDKLTASQRLELLPYLKCENTEILNIYRQESPAFATHSALVNAENGEWSADAMRHLATMLRSKTDAIRIRAQMLLSDSDGIKCTQIGQSALLEAAKLFGARADLIELFWFQSFAAFDDEVMFDALCEMSVGETRREESLDLLLALGRFNTQVASKFLTRLAQERDPALRRVLFISARLKVEWNFIGALDREALAASLVAAIQSDLPDLLKATALETLGFLGGHAIRVIESKGASSYVIDPETEPGDSLPPDVLAAIRLWRMLSTSLLALEEHALDGNARLAWIVSCGRLAIPSIDYKCLLNQQEAPEVRAALYAAMLLGGKKLSQELTPCSTEEEIGCLLPAHLVTVRTSIYDEQHCKWVGETARFVLDCWENDLVSPLDALSDIIEREFAHPVRFSASDLTYPHFRLYRDEDALEVMAALVESSPDRMESYLLGRWPTWRPHLTRIATHDAGFQRRAAAVRILGLSPVLETDALSAILGGMLDIPQVSSVAYDVCGRVARLSVAAVREALDRIKGESQLEALSAARLLDSACRTAIFKARDADEEHKLAEEARTNKRLLEETIQEVSHSGAGSKPVFEFSPELYHIGALAEPVSLATKLIEILFSARAINIGPAGPAVEPRDLMPYVQVTLPTKRDGRIRRVEISDFEGKTPFFGQGRMIPEAERKALLELVSFCQTNEVSLSGLVRKRTRSCDQPTGSA